VNPTQFGQGEDLSSYPRSPEADLEQLRDGGCDLAFLPADETIYPNGTDDLTRVLAAPSLAGTLEGASRPGHFDGVVTVVARLFNLCRPDIAVFGEKDFQQLRVVQRMVEDLGYPLRILAVPTVREAGGLAMSSRNRYLDREARRLAVGLSRVLDETADAAAADRAAHEELERGARKQLEARGFRVDYVAIRRAADLEPGQRGESGLRVLAAAWLGTTRLIDNRPVS
jgi:pantoate--beta-alanine ligase